MVESAITDLGQLVHCPFCQTVLRNRPTLAWQMARCPTCQNQFVMPGSAASPVAQPVDTFGPAHWATASIQEPLPPIEEPDIPCQVAPARGEQPTTRPDLAAARLAVLPVAAPVTPNSIPQHIAQAVQTASSIAAEAAPLPTGELIELAKVAAEAEEEPAPWTVRDLVRNAPAWVISLMMHAAVIILLGMFTLAVEYDEYISLDMAWFEPDSTSLDNTAFKVEVEDPQPVTELSISEQVLEADPFAAPPKMEVTPVVGLAPTFDFSAAKIGMALDGRDPAARAMMVAKYGGTAESEAAVGKGLEWLSHHQMADGSWSFDHSRAPQCRGKCRNVGGTRSETGSTALALLPFLGAGQTHEDGRYQNTVRRGLYYLANQVRHNGGVQSGDLQGGKSGNMYCHGLATIALCEAYAMTQDKGLRTSAQKALDFIVYAQDPVGGGWRYGPQQSGDTSVVGWQLMALKSGHMAYLKVPPKTVTKAQDFLDSVGSYDGAYYGYTAPGEGQATTAIGLLCRMYLGWKKDNPGLIRGVAALDQQGPSRDDMYYNYYATQVLHHWGGEEWKRWNSELRDYLVKAQANNSHEKGSWYIPHHWNHSGGRLYNTSLAILTLEVYYRHLPIYRENAVKDEFE